MENKWINMAEFNAYISDLFSAIDEYEEKAAAHKRAQDSFTGEANWEGKSADKAKLLVGTVEQAKLDEILRIERDFRALLTDYVKGFKAAVDEADDAKISTIVLEGLNIELHGCASTYKTWATGMECLKDNIHSRFGSKYGNCDEYDFFMASNAYGNLCGNASKDGMILDLINRFTNFDNQQSAKISSVSFPYRIGKLKQEIEELRSCKGMLVNGDGNIEMGVIERLEDFLEDSVNRAEGSGSFVDKLGVNVLCSIQAYDPVDMCSGNYINEHVDIELGGRYPLSFGRFYNAMDKKGGRLGKGWKHTFEKRIVEEDGIITIEKSDGSKGEYKKIDDVYDKDLYFETQGEPGLLEKLTGGYVITQDDGTYERFDDRGYLVALGDIDGDNVSFTYDIFGGKYCVTHISTKNGNTLTFEYLVKSIFNELGKTRVTLMTSVTDQAGRCVSYAYDDDRLTEIKEADGAVRKFTYTEDGRIKDVVNPRGITAVTNEYDNQGRIKRQSFPDNTFMTYEYNDEDKNIVATERNGNEVTYTHDDFGRHIETAYYDGKETYSYNGMNLKTSLTDKNGNTTKIAYDNRGHVTQVIDALGNKTNITYRADGKLHTVKGPRDDTYKYFYNKNGTIKEIAAPGGNARIFAYSEGNIKAIFDDRGIGPSFTYDDRGNVATVTDPDGVKTSYKYDELNRVVETVSADGAKTTFEYDNADRIVKVADALGNTREYRYDKSGKVTSVKDFDGTIKCYDINIMGRVSKLTDEEGRSTEITYNVMGKQELVTLPNGGRIKYEYDPLMRLIKVTDPEGRTTGYDYDKNGNVTAEYLGDVRVKSYVYDALNRVTEETDALGHKTGYTYDEAGNVTEVTDTLGNVSKREYDLLNRVTKETDALGNEVSYKYTKMDLIDSITDAAGRVRRFTYTDGKRLTSVSFCGVTEQELTYDEAGRVKTRKFADGYEINYGYDALSRVNKVTGSDGRCVEYEYDALGRATKVIDGNSTTLYTYTATGRLKSVVDALGNETAYTYDALDNLKSVHRVEGLVSNEEKSGDVFPTVGKDGRVTIYSYNLSGQITSVTDALGQVEAYEYDQYGRLLAKTDRDNYRTTYSYNALGSVSNVAYSDGRSVAFAYNELNQLNEINDWLGKTTLENDVLGRLTKVTDFKNRTVVYEYGATGERTKLVYPDGKEAVYNYNDKLQLESIVSGNDKTTYAYDEIGRLTEKLLPNSIKQAYEYLPGGNLKSMVSSDKEGVLDKYFYSYNNAGLIGEINRDRRGLDKVSGQYTYGYDVLGRLKESSFNGIIKSAYEYDAFGNRTSLVEAETKTMYVYDVLDRLIETNEFNSSQAIKKNYAYDKRGNQTKEYIDGLLQKTFIFDATNMLSKVVDAKNGELENQYNGLGIRVTSTRTEEKIEYLCDLSRGYYNLLERTVNGEKESFVYDNNVVSMLKEGNSYYYLQDELGSPMYMTGTDGVAVSAYAFDDFGRNIDPFTGKQKKHGYTKEGNIIQPFAFTGYQEDEVSGLKFAQARFYNANTGRFQSEDLVKGIIAFPKTINHYLYCWESPLGYVDRDGLFGEWIAEAGDFLHKTQDKINSKIGNSPVGKWINDNKEVLGVALMATGVVAGVAFSITGNPVLGGAISGALTDMGNQIAINGTNVDWGEVVLSTASGAAAGAIGDYAFVKEGVKNAKLLNTGYKVVSGAISDTFFEEVTDLWKGKNISFDNVVGDFAKNTVITGMSEGTDILVKTKGAKYRSKRFAELSGNSEEYQHLFREAEIADKNLARARKNGAGRDAISRWITKIGRAHNRLESFEEQMMKGTDKLIKRSSKFVKDFFVDGGISIEKTVEGYFEICEG
ncbi:DUF6531 domain-containing protein [Butyrivibrio sp. M55]|uniref:DUF6531 domain-containing protein n=1 Tax=Butyrivibrio sp. M55 TaxID=1855323 RepID=UPI0008EA919C|nr:DUF6531 domain-containing protein [Butyrivibrio sp. M55]SFU67644.1 RHS repeat-associated core domain-containing protein [Butyrivibrio sp. M55]